jgi:hypothetical protein
MCPTALLLSALPGAATRNAQNQRRRLQAGATLTAAVSWRANDASAGAAVASEATQCCPFKAGCPADGVCAGAGASYPLGSVAIGKPRVMGLYGRFVSFLRTTDQ